MGQCHWQCMIMQLALARSQAHSGSGCQWHCQCQSLSITVGCTGLAAAETQAALPVWPALAALALARDAGITPPAPVARDRRLCPYYYCSSGCANPVTGGGYRDARPLALTRRQSEGRDASLNDAGGGTGG